jgi:hypothetical protein
MDARILIKHSTSKCNQELLQFLHQNLSTIKKKYNLKTIIVYDEHIAKLENCVKKLPMLIVGGKSIVGNADIKKFLSPTSTASADPCDLDDYWNKEMHSKDDDVDEDEMDKVKNRALDQSVKRTTSSKKKPPVKEDDEPDNIQLKDLDSIIDDDPIMQKFWANQESTPGFE